MSLTGAYDPANVFSRIIAGQIPAAKVYEDDEVLVFMDAFPQSKGHCLVISKTSRARNILEIEPKPLGRVIGAVQKVTRAIDAALQPDGIVVKQYNGAAAGQTVFHLHFHLIPRWEGVAEGAHGKGMADPAELAQLAAQISARLA